MLTPAAPRSAEPEPDRSPGSSAILSPSISSSHPSMSFGYQHAASDEFSPGAIGQTSLPRSISSESIIPGAPVNNIISSTSTTAIPAAATSIEREAEHSLPSRLPSYQHYLQLHHNHPATTLDTILEKNPNSHKAHTPNADPNIQQQEQQQQEYLPLQQTDIKSTTSSDRGGPIPIAAAGSIPNKTGNHPLLGSPSFSSSTPLHTASTISPSSLQMSSSSPVPLSSSSSSHQIPLIPAINSSHNQNGLPRLSTSGRKEGEPEPDEKQSISPPHTQIHTQTHIQTQTQTAISPPTSNSPVRPLIAATLNNASPHQHLQPLQTIHPLTSLHSPSAQDNRNANHRSAQLHPHQLHPHPHPTTPPTTSSTSSTHQHHPSSHSSHTASHSPALAHHTDGASDSSKIRAAVEESPDAKWARYAVKLGSGTFKDVWLGIDTETGKEVAWNVVDFRRVQVKDQKRIRMETHLLTQLRHPHIIEMYDVWENPQKQEFCFITQKSSYTLKQHIANLHPAKIKVLKKYCRQILSALVYLHGLHPPIIHRDIKCDNIFIDGTTGDIRIGDFGLSISSTNPTSIVGTPGYISPEMFGESYNELVDIWSFGMCVLEMATNQYPYAEYNGSVAQLLKKGYEGAKPEALTNLADPGLREFISMCLQPVHLRPSAKQLLDQKVFDLSEPIKTTAAAPPAAVNTALIPPPVLTSTSSQPLAETTATPNRITTGAQHQQSSTPVQITEQKAKETHTDSVSSPSPPVTPANIHSPEDHLPLSSLPTNVTSLGLSVSAGPPPAALSVHSNLSPELPSMPQRSFTPPIALAGLSPRSAAQSVPNPLSVAIASLPSVSSSTSLSSSGSIRSASSQSSRQDDVKQELYRRRSESLIPRVEVTKTDKLNIVSIILYVRFPSARELRRARKEKLLQQKNGNGVDDSSALEVQDLEEEEVQDSKSCEQTASPTQTQPSQQSQKGDSPNAATVASNNVGREIRDVTDVVAADSSIINNITPPTSQPVSPVTSQELTPIRIPSYDFSRDNYLAVATDLVHKYVEFQSLELEGVEELVALRIEEGTRERYNKWAAKARTTLNSEIMTLLTSLGIGLNYALSFIEQEVSIEDLPYLSEEDLATFIPKLGPRRRLQQYINEVKAANAAQQHQTNSTTANNNTNNQNNSSHSQSLDKKAEGGKKDKKDKGDKEKEKDKKDKDRSLISSSSITPTNSMIQAMAANKGAKDKSSTRDRSESKAAKNVKDKEKDKDKDKDKDRSEAHRERDRERRDDRREDEADISSNSINGDTSASSRDRPSSLSTPKVKEKKASSDVNNISPIANNHNNINSQHPQTGNSN